MFSHFHPLIIHFPVGILLFAAFMMLWQWITKKDLSSAIELAFVLGAISAVLGCISGWLLSKSGDYDAALVSKHQWTAIATAIISLLLVFFKKMRLLLVILMMFLLTIAGHYGATLTHGENYLFENKSEAKLDSVSENPSTDSIKTINALKKDSAVAQVYNPYREDIAPILKTYCYNCHSAIKMKNGLRLDKPSFILKGGKNGKILLPHDPTHSKLYAHLLLPLDDDKHMPPKGKKQLSSKQIKTIGDWILKGANFEDVVIAPTKKTEEKLEAEPILAQEDIPQKVPDLIKDAAMPAKKLEADFSNTKEFSISLLQALPKNELTSLKLSNQPITDQQLSVIAGFNKIEVLNLYGTKITDSGLRLLSNSKSLKKLYLYNTQVSKEAVDQLKKQLPELEVESGNFKFDKPDSVKKLKP
ncbi:MAG: hypothetical protein JST58_13040 [Bacteroidetes bacterium]|nr:hypothetical protein [Bacteroidota bacterium]